MKSSRILVIGFLILVCIPIIFVLASIFFPAKFEVKRSIEIEAKPAEIFPYVNNMRNWIQWTPWNVEVDSTIEYSFSGPLQGVGSQQIWEADQIGSGVMTIQESVAPDSLQYNVIFNANYEMDGKFVFTSIGTNETRVTWTMMGQTGFAPNRKIMASLMDEKMGIDRERGLKNLKELVEGFE